MPDAKMAALQKLLGSRTNSPIRTQSKCLLGKFLGPWMRMSCEECSRNSVPSTKSTSCVIRLPDKVKVRQNRSTFLLAKKNGRMTWLIKSEQKAQQDSTIHSDPRFFLFHFYLGPQYFINIWC